jgi:hypothetical protein
MFPKKRRLQGQHTAPASWNAPREFTKSWKGRVLVRNKTVKKPERATRDVVWFAAEPAQEIVGSIELVPEKCGYPDYVRARQCLTYELHFYLKYPLPEGTKLMSFATLYKVSSLETSRSSAEEVKEGVVNNYAYVRCSGLSNSFLYFSCLLSRTSRCCSISQALHRDPFSESSFPGGMHSPKFPSLTV